MWKDIVGLHREKKLFQSAIINKKLAGSYCFIGIEGIGKDAFALEVAKTVNCFNPIKSIELDAEIEVQTINACEECKSCQMANNMSHPNIQFVFAQPNDDKIDEKVNEIIKSELRNKIANRYHRVVIPNANHILISSIRVLKKRSVMTSSLSGRRFIIISGGDTMNVDAANAFLKTLEEPQLDMTIIITSAKREKLLNTILSRCQQINFEPLSFVDVAKYIEEQYHKSETTSRLIATISQGSITKAMDILDENINAMRNMAVDMLGIALKRKVFRVPVINMLNNKLFSKKDKNVYVQFLTMLLLWIRDVYTIAMVNDAKFVFNTDLVERMIKFHKGFPKADLVTAITEIENAISMIEGNVDPQLVFLNMFVKFRKIFLD